MKKIEGLGKKAADPLGNELESTVATMIANCIFRTGSARDPVRIVDLALKLRNLEEKELFEVDDKDYDEIITAIKSDQQLNNVGRYIMLKALEGDSNGANN